MRYNFISVTPMAVEFLGQMHVSIGSITITDLHICKDIYKIPLRSQNSYRSISGIGVDYRFLST